MEKKLERLKNNYIELEKQMSSPEILSDQNRMRDLNREHSRLSPIIMKYNEYIKLKQELADSWDEIEGKLAKLRDAEGSSEGRDTFLSSLSGIMHNQSVDYISTIQGLSQELRAAGTHWLMSIVDEVTAASLGELPSFR